MKVFTDHLNEQLATLEQQGLIKYERELCSPQSDRIQVNGRTVLNFCANNYLGLANHPYLIDAAISTLKSHGFGLSSVRFICGTQDIHKMLEQKLSQWLETEDTILYSSCFDANGGLFETLFTEEDAVISDALNHASIIDGIRLSKMQRYRYANHDMQDLEKQLILTAQARYRLIVTDGVFSMDGSLANLPSICELAEKYQALVMVDDSHALGILGKDGTGTPAHYGLKHKIDIITGTLGKALGGASGGFTSGKKPIIDWLRQRSRPYLFSNSLAPAVVGASIAGLSIIQQQPALRTTLHQNADYFRKGMEKLGYTLLPGSHPIIPVMLGDATKAKLLADSLLTAGIYVIGFSYPVVPLNTARIRIQLSALHTKDELNLALNAFEDHGKKWGILP